MDNSKVHPSRPHYKTIGDPREFSSSDEKVIDMTPVPQFQLKPRYDEKSLVRQFTMTIVRCMQREINETPIEYYEAQLFSNSKQWALQLHGKRMSIEPIDLLHHICKLKENEELLDITRQQELNANLERVIFDHPSAFEEYKLVAALVEVLSGLIVKWDILVPENYQYRIRGRTMVLKILNLTQLSSSVLSLDTLWLATIVHIPPFSKLMEESVRQYGFILIEEFQKLLNYVLSLNPINLREENNVPGYLAAKIPFLRQNKHMEPDFGARRVRYQELSLPSGLMKKCAKIKSNAAVGRLRRMLSDFEMLYRAFEIAVVRSLMVISNS